MILEEDLQNDGAYRGVRFHKWHAPVGRRNTGIYGIHRRKLDVLVMNMFGHSHWYARVLRRETGIADRRVEWWLWAKET